MKTLHCERIVEVKDRKNIWLTNSVTIKNLLVKHALVDSGIRFGPASNVVVSKIGNPIYQKSSTRVDIIDRHLTYCFGVIEDDVIECFGMTISMDLHVILLNVPSCSLVLVRPWMQELHVI